MSQQAPVDLVELQEQLRAALKLPENDPSASSPLAYLRLFQEAKVQENGAVRLATEYLLEDALAELVQDQERYATVLRLRFQDGKSSMKTAIEMNIAQATVFKWQRQALEQLAIIVAGQEQQAHLRRSIALADRLPPTNARPLIGVQQHLGHLMSLLTAQDIPWLISLEGLGGIGKTALADALLRQALEENHFDDFAWISARQRGLLSSDDGMDDQPAMKADDLIERLLAQLLPNLRLSLPFSAEKGLAALQARLKYTPHLIVIDNLESLADLQALLPTLRRLAGPSKFLLTTRIGLDTETDITRFALPELDQAATVELIRQEAMASNLAQLAAAPDDHLTPIFETVGGNPLAIKLVVGQVHLLSLEQVLANLREAKGRRIETLYRFIYWDAWQRLGDEARQVLILMPLFSQHGADLSSIELISDVRDAALMDALAHLVKLSLVNVGGDYRVKRYSIHRLTESFLLQEVVKWQQTPPDEQEAESNAP